MTKFETIKSAIEDGILGSDMIHYFIDCAFENNEITAHESAILQGLLG